ncbi:hypothetical protein KPSA1_02275 [Pseudomonas syringae pv. actinidiae]|uniref:Uncharacterized protein n=1 Tax=Pseudomonas syringae pv. actinidiae TaxID=103796 RepID=A0A2V0Q8S6_PSESF|nr:hypothetical protein KPSA1_02275 [Pseudomonas syringae pv. actinidiae]
MTGENTPRPRLILPCLTFARRLFVQSLGALKTDETNEYSLSGM